ncbi:unnamed protein product [marine sediment metagenome]|uniref:Uncharacterized protein n=1 Tax=marine sediment metagenome TaxID=412755 RepID=X1IQN6_9ZZZZ
MINNLSAKGSSTFPSSVIDSVILAINPSKKSVKAANVNRRNAQIDDLGSKLNIKNIINGINDILNKLIIFGINFLPILQSFVYLW